MTISTRILQKFIAFGGIAGVTLSFPFPAFAADAVQLELRPHCEQADVTQCPTFPVRDPESLQGPVLSTGQTLDVDLVIQNPTGAAVSRVRAAISYDAATLEGNSIELLELTVPTPGEKDFNIEEGIIHIQATSAQPLTASVIRVARIRLTVKNIKDPFSIMAFYDAGKSITANTFVADASDGVLSGTTNSSLFIPLGGNAASSVTASSLASAMSASSVAMSSVIAPSVAFPMLQPQNVRVTTEKNTAYVGWDLLQSNELIGYNVYYGTVSGKYIQRRSTDKSSAVLAIRDLPENAVYFFAVRGVNAAEQETDFSQEQSVTIGKPQTSTAPLTGVSGGPDGKPPVTNGTVSGETGAPSMFLMALILSAVMGTAFALRRQFRTVQPL